MPGRLTHPDSPASRAAAARVVLDTCVPEFRRLLRMKPREAKAVLAMTEGRAAAVERLRTARRASGIANDTQAQAEAAALARAMASILARRARLSAVQTAAAELAGFDRELRNVRKIIAHHEAKRRRLVNQIGDAAAVLGLDPADLVAVPG